MKMQKSLLIFIFCFVLFVTMSCNSNKTHDILGGSFEEVQTPFYVSLATPQDNETYVDVGTSITFVFNKPIKQGSFVSSFSLSKGGEDVQGGYTFSSETTITFRPDEMLQYNTIYVINVSSTVETTDGQVLDVPFASTFTTETIIIPPVPTLTSPIDNTSKIHYAGHTIEFKWEITSSAESFELQIDNNSDFSSPDEYEFVGTSTIMQVSPDIYYWRVRSQIDDEKSTFSSSFKLTVATDVQFVDMWGTDFGLTGSGGTEPGEFRGPMGIFISDFKDVFVTEQMNHRIQIFNFNGVYKSQIGSSGSGNGEFNLPTGILVHDEFIYVVDCSNHRVQKFNLNDNSYITKWGTSGSGDGEFNFPSSITIDTRTSLSSPLIYVTDSGNYRFQVFDTDGNFLTKYDGNNGTGDGEFDAPYGITIDDEEGFVYLCEQGNRINKFSPYPEFSFLGWCGADTGGGSGWHEPGSGKVPTSGTGHGEFNMPYLMTFDPSGNILVCDALNSRAQVFNKENFTPLGWIGKDNNDKIGLHRPSDPLSIPVVSNSPPEIGAFNGPHGIGTYHQYIFVTDLNNHRVQKFELVPTASP